MKILISMKLIVVTLLALSSIAFASPIRATRISFEETWSRYPTPDALVRRFRNLVSNDERNYYYVGANCTKLAAENRAFLGDADPVTGEAIIGKPNASFMNWYAGCLKEIITADRNGFSSRIGNINDEKILVNIFSAPVVAECKKVVGRNRSLQITGDQIASYCLWTQLSVQAQEALIEQQIDQLVGPEELIVDLGIAGSTREFATRIREELQSAIDSKDDRYSKALNVRPEDLLGAMSIIKFLINMNDILVY